MWFDLCWLFVCLRRHLLGLMCGAFWWWFSSSPMSFDTRALRSDFSGRHVDSQGTSWSRRWTKGRGAETLSEVCRTVGSAPWNLIGPRVNKSWLTNKLVLRTDFDSTSNCHPVWNKTVARTVDIETKMNCLRLIPFRKQCRLQIVHQGEDSSNCGGKHIFFVNDMKKLLPREETEDLIVMTRSLSCRATSESLLKTVKASPALPRQIRRLSPAVTWSVHTQKSEPAEKLVVRNWHFEARLVANSFRQTLCFEESRDVERCWNWMWWVAQCANIHVHMNNGATNGASALTWEVWIQYPQAKAGLSHK